MKNIDTYKPNLRQTIFQIRWGVGCFLMSFLDVRCSNIQTYGEEGGEESGISGRDFDLILCLSSFIRPSGASENHQQGWWWSHPLFLYFARTDLKHSSNIVASAWGLAIRYFLLKNQCLEFWMTFQRVWVEVTLQMQSGGRCYFSHLYCPVEAVLVSFW